MFSRRNIKKNNTLFSWTCSSSATSMTFCWPASVAQLDACPTGDQEVACSAPAGSAISFVELDHEIFSTVILSLPLIQEGQFSVS